MSHIVPLSIVPTHGGTGHTTMLAHTSVPASQSRPELECGGDVTDVRQLVDVTQYSILHHR